MQNMSKDIWNGFNSWSSQPVVEPGEGSLALAHHLLLHAARVDDILEVKCELSITRVGGRKGRHAATFTHRQLLHRVAKC